MKRSMLPVAGLAVVASLLSGQLHAQSLTFHVGGGAAMGSGDLGDATKTGWIGFAGADVPIASMPGASIGATASYTHIPYEGEGDDATNIPALFANLGYLFGAASPSRIKPWVRAGVGVLQHRYDAGNVSYDEEESETKVGATAGVGVSFVTPSVRPFVGASFVTGGSDTQFIAVYAGFNFGGVSRAAIRRR